MASKPDLVLFFEGTKGDYRNRKLSNILQWSDDDLEASHDYIQTLFPLPEASGLNWNAPIVDRKVFEVFRSEAKLRAKLHLALTRMLSFYGFRWSEDGGSVKVDLADNFDKAKENWVRRFDHNHLRITRILRSSRVLGLENEALAFYRRLKWVQERSSISSRSLQFWTRAMQRPLYVAPDVDEEDEHYVRGAHFLREFEEMRRKQFQQTVQSPNVNSEGKPNHGNGQEADNDPNDDAQTFRGDGGKESYMLEKEAGSSDKGETMKNGLGNVAESNDNKDDSTEAESGKEPSPH